MHMKVHRKLMKKKRHKENLKSKLAGDLLNLMHGMPSKSCKMMKMNG